MNSSTQNRKHEIITTSAKLFKEKGYSAVTMRDIAAALGIKASSLYNHISSKQDILKEIIISLAEEFTNGMKIIKFSNETSINKLKQIIALHIHISTQKADSMAALNNDWMHLEEQLDYYKNLRSEYENDFRNILINGIKSEEIINVKPDILLFSILSTLRFLYLWIPKKEDLIIEELTATLSKVLISGIRK